MNDTTARSELSEFQAELSEASTALKAFAAGPAREAANDVGASFERAGQRIATALGRAATGGEAAFKQRRTLEAYLGYWDESGDANPASSLNAKPMIEEIMLWAWDARPHPAFPARSDVWSDGANWRLGHWLNGRAGLSELSEVVLQVCARGGVADADATALTGAVSGYVVDAPASARAALEPLMAAHDFTCVERAGRIVFFHREDGEPADLSLGDLVADSAGDAFAQRADAADTPLEARVRFLDPGRDYLIASVSARRLDQAEGGVIGVDAPLVLEPEAAEAMAQRVLADARAANETQRLGLGPTHIALEPGDLVSLDGGAAFEIVRCEDAETRQLELRRARAGASATLGLAEPGASGEPAFAPTPAFAVLDLPLLPGAEHDERPLTAVFAAPWFGAHEIYAGAAQTRRARVTQPAVMGELLWPLWPGPVDRWDDGNKIKIKLYGGALEAPRLRPCSTAPTSSLSRRTANGRSCRRVHACLRVPTSTNSPVFCAGGSARRMRCVGHTRSAPASWRSTSGLGGLRLPRTSGSKRSHSPRRRRARHQPTHAPRLSILHCRMRRRDRGRPRTCAPSARPAAMSPSHGCVAPGWAATPGAPVSRLSARHARPTHWRCLTATRWSAL